MLTVRYMLCTTQKPFFPKIVLPRASNSYSIEILPVHHSSWPYRRAIELTVRFGNEIVVLFAIEITKFRFYSSSITESSSSIEISKCSQHEGGVNIVRSLKPFEEPEPDMRANPEIFKFVARSTRPYRFYFNNKSPYHETIDFDVHSNHVEFSDHHAKDGDVYDIVDVHTAANQRLMA
ncbi:hypothetical protein V8G54_007014 [Vigna mungo]|uniref:Uncharacterized protein n=1 Tax=Vigna mungo TaxID=3915 RepID=A0AAQ3P320_VIGMU